ncbi:hypothetical protein [Plantibacter sp. RU18]|uniref:hypothetical protein n=1 Tax=Plantibacter sp. RU18 TaxID=3158143 RepID=UPI003D367EE4
MRELGQNFGCEVPLSDGHMFRDEVAPVRVVCGLADIADVEYGEKSSLSVKVDFPERAETHFGVFEVYRLIVNIRLYDNAPCPELVSAVFD